MGNNILYINACPRPDSRTKALADCLVGELQGNINELRVFDMDLKPLDFEGLQKRDALLSKGETDSHELRLAREFAQADTIVIAAPYWDLLFPAVVRTYLENICVCGVTFRYTPQGRPEGMCKAKKLYYVTTAGGYIGGNNFGYDYVKALFAGLFGINEAVCFTAQGLDIIGNDPEDIMDKAKQEIKNSL